MKGRDGLTKKTIMHSHVVRQSSINGVDLG